MERQDRQTRDSVDRVRPSDAAAANPGKHTLIEALATRGPIQAKGNPAGDADAVHAAAERGTQGSPTALPHGDQIGRAFGKHDVSNVQAYVGGPASEATGAMGAQAYATGNKVAFGSSPDLHTAAHEAAHVVQQRGGVQLKGGVGEAGDAYERNADAVADRVVAGQSAEDLLDERSESKGGGNPAGSAGRAGGEATRGIDASASGGATQAVQRDTGSDNRMLAQQAELGNTDREIPALEGALLSTRLQAVQRGLLSRASYDAGLALSRAMTMLQPAVAARGAVDAGLKEQAAAAAQRLFAALRAEAGGDENFRIQPSMGGGGTSISSENPYTSEHRVTSYFLIWSSQVTVSWLERLPEIIRAGQWADAFRGYRQIVDGLDLWVADQLRRTGNAQDEARGNAQAHYSHLRTGLEQIAGHHATRLPALFHPDAQTVSEERAAGRPVTDTVPMNVYYWQEQDGRTHLYDLTTPSQPREQVVNGQPTAAIMNTFFEEVARYPKGQVKYNLPSGAQGVAPTTGKLKWYEWVGIAGLVLAGVGLAVLSAGASVPATVIFATGAIAGGVSAAGHLQDSVQLGTATTASVVLDVAQIVSSFASVGALAITVRAGSAAAAIANSRWFVPLVTTAAGADVVQMVALTDITVEELNRIQGGAGSPQDKQRAMAVLLTQLIVAGGLTALSVQGARNTRALSGQQLEIVEQNGVPVLRIVGDQTPAPAAATSGRVTEPIPGLYESIDPSFRPQGWTFRDTGPHPHPDHPTWVQIRTEVTGPNGTRGWIERSYDPATKTVVMENAFLSDLPSWVEAGMPLRQGRGTPTVSYLTMRLMRMLGVGFGEPRVVKMSTIQNIEAVMQLEQMRRNGVSYQQAVAQTHSVQYATTSIQQSGSTITSVNIDTAGAFRWRLSAMMDHFNMPPAERQALFARYGLTANDEVLVNYDIIINVSPHPTAQNRP
jgi:hypothetical protein